MNPNNNQPINSNPLGQPATPPTAAPQIPQSGGKKGIILLIILLILALGMGGYVLFAKNQLNNKQKTAAENTSIAIPTTTITPTVTPATINEVMVASPEADLINIEKDIQGL